MVRKAFGWWLVVGLWGGALSASCVGERFGGGADDCTDDDSCVDAGPGGSATDTDDATDDDAPADDEMPDAALEDDDDILSDDSADDADDSVDDADNSADDSNADDDGTTDDVVEDDSADDDTNADDDNLDDPADDDGSPDDDVVDAGGPAQPTTPAVRSDCVEPADGPVRAYFEVPGTENAELGDYFRLPFPNDFYRSDDGIALGDYPTVTAASEVFVDAVNATAKGFSASPTIYFRFSGRVDFETLIPRFNLRDITDPERTSSPPLRLVYSPQAGRYLCYDALSVRPTAGYALKPGRVYAAWLETGILDASGNPLTRSPQFASMLTAEAPTDPTLAALHAKFDPLRAFLETIELEADDLLNATVFTVDDPLAPMEQLAEIIDELPVPETVGWVMCEDGVTSPCENGDASRACGPESPDYVEYHGVVSLPIFQEGTAPYFDSGGQISLTGPVRYENVCTAVTVPREGDSNGYPIVLYSHGASGSFRSHVKPSVAGVLSRGLGGLADLEPRRFVVVGYDGVQHGPRRGNDPQTSGISSDLLLFNFLNPTGTLGTSLQGGADVLSMGRFAKSLADEELQEQADGRFLAFMGQSQGSLQGAIAIPYTDEFNAAIFTGAGAGFVPSMLARQAPAIIPTAIAQAVFDPGGEGEPVRGGEFHPALALVQHLVDPADPLHHASRLVTEPVTDPLHVFHIYGTRDRASAAIAQKTFATAAGLGIVQAHSSVTDTEGLGEALDQFPLVGNVSNNGEAWTAGVRQYAPAEGADGHFVAFDVEGAQIDLSVFLSAAASGEVPPIGSED